MSIDGPAKATATYQASAAPIGQPLQREPQENPPASVEDRTHIMVDGGNPPASSDLAKWWTTTMRKGESLWRFVWLVSQEAFDDLRNELSELSFWTQRGYTPAQLEAHNRLRVEIGSGTWPWHLNALEAWREVGSELQVADAKTSPFDDDFARSIGRAIRQRIAQSKMQAGASATADGRKPTTAPDEDEIAEARQICKANPRILRTVLMTQMKIGSDKASALLDLMRQEGIHKSRKRKPAIKRR